MGNGNNAFGRRPQPTVAMIHDRADILSARLEPQKRRLGEVRRQRDGPTVHANKEIRTQVASIVHTTRFEYSAAAVQDESVRKEIAWATNLQEAWRRYSHPQGIITPFVDALVEFGIGFIEIDEPREPWAAPGLQIGDVDFFPLLAPLLAARYVDPMAVLFDDSPDDRCVIINERKASDILRKMAPAPWAFGVPGSYCSAGSTVSTRGGYDTETLRYYDSYWRAYVVDDEMVEVDAHGLTDLPVYIGRTNASNFKDDIPIIRVLEDYHAWAVHSARQFVRSTGRSFDLSPWSGGAPIADLLLRPNDVSDAIIRVRAY